MFREIDTSGDEQAEWEEITSFLDGAEIAYDKTALKQDFVNSDVNGDGKLSLDEFIEAYKRGSISDIFCIPTRNRQKIPHHADVQQRDRGASRRANRMLPGHTCRHRLARHTRWTNIGIVNNWNW